MKAARISPVDVAVAFMHFFADALACPFEIFEGELWSNGVSNATSSSWHRY